MISLNNLPINSIESWIKNFCTYDKNNHIWYRSSGNYWYNAWDRMPYESSEGKKLYVLPAFHNFIILLINSQLFYIWMRIFGDGRYLNKDILRNMPIPELDHIKSYQNQIENKKTELMKALFKVFDDEHNSFGTSNIKLELDKLDFFLLELYQAPKADFQLYFTFLSNFEKSIHGGQKLKLDTLQS